LSTLDPRWFAVSIAAESRPLLLQVDTSQAVLATLTYRLASYRAPLVAGPIAYGLFRLRYRSRPEPPQVNQAHT
jgi:hypothetical protein